MFGTGFTNPINKKQPYKGFYVVIQNENEIVNLTKREVLPEHDKLGTKIQISVHESTDIKNKVLKVCSQQHVVKMGDGTAAVHSNGTCKYVTNSEHEISLEDNIPHYQHNIC